MFKSIFTFARRRWYVFLLIAGVLGFLLLRSRSNREPKLTFTHPIRETIEETVEVSGNISARKIAKLKFLGGGKLTYLGVAEGDSVTKNKRIASIDSRDLRKSLEESLNLSNIGRNNLDQGRFDTKDSGLTETVVRKLANLQYTLNNNVLDVELRDIAIQNSSLYSPFDGVVTTLPTNAEGMQVTATDFFEIIDPTTLEFVGEVDEVDVGRVKIGFPAHIILDAYEDDTDETTVDQIALKATASSKATGGTVFLVRAPLPSDFLHYRVGMNGTMLIVVRREENALSVPISSITQREGKTVVRVKVGREVKDREIITGIENDERIQVISGLSEDDEIVEIQ